MDCSPKHCAGIPWIQRGAQDKTMVHIAAADTSCGPRHVRVSPVSGGFSRLPFKRLTDVEERYRCMNDLCMYCETREPLSYSAT